MKPKFQDSNSGDVDGALTQGGLSDLLGYQLRKAQVAAYQNFAEVLESQNISPGQVGVLLLVRANPGVNQTRVGNALGIDRSTLVAVIDRLEGRDLIARTPSQKDRRSHALLLTAEGEAYLKTMLPRLREHERQIAVGLSDNERRNLIALLNKVGVS